MKNKELRGKTNHLVILDDYLFFESSEQISKDFEKTRNKVQLAVNTCPDKVTFEDALKQVAPLSRNFLLSRGFCCKMGCKNCPWNFKKV